MYTGNLTLLRLHSLSRFSWSILLYIIRFTFKTPRLNHCPPYLSSPRTPSVSPREPKRKFFPEQFRVPHVKGLEEITITRPVDGNVTLTQRWVGYIGIRLPTCTGVVILNRQEQVETRADYRSGLRIQRMTQLDLKTSTVQQTLKYGLGQRRRERGEATV